MKKKLKIIKNPVMISFKKRKSQKKTGKVKKKSTGSPKIDEISEEDENRMSSPERRGKKSRPRSYSLSNSDDEKIIKKNEEYRSKRQSLHLMNFKIDNMGDSEIERSNSTNNIKKITPILRQRRRELLQSRENNKNWEQPVGSAANKLKDNFWQLQFDGLREIYKKQKKKNKRFI